MMNALWNINRIERLYPWSGESPAIEMPGSMTAEECNAHASACAAKAAMAQDDSVAMEFLTLAAHWRAMGAREIFLGSIEHSIDPTDALSRPADPRI